MASIRDLLKRKKLTGDEVGRAIIASLAHDLRGEKPALFTQDDLEQMKGALVSDEDIELYNGYVGLESTLLLYQATQQGYFQQAQNGLHRLSGYMSRTFMAMQLTLVIDAMGEDAPAEAMGVLKQFRDEHYPGSDAFDSVPVRLAYEELLLPSLRQIYAFNAFFDVIAARYGLEDVANFKIDMTMIEAQCDQYNFMHQQFAQNDPGVSDVLPRIDYTTIRPTHEALAAVRDRLPELSAFRRPPLHLIDILSGKASGSEI